MMRSESKVYFFFEKKGFALNKRTLLKAFIEKLFKKEKVPLGTINYVFCSDKKLLEINKTYLKHDYYTDIISFDLSAQGLSEHGKNGLRKNKKLAEIYISVDRIRENAKKLDISFNNELHRVIFHGALHICGYKDKKQSDRLTMRKKEDHYLVSWGFVPRGTRP